MTHLFDDSQASRFALSELNEDVTPFDRDDKAFDVAPSRRAKNLAGRNVGLRAVQRACDFFAKKRAFAERPTNV